MKRQMRKAFTLVEILIVVIILGILAAIVIPQFTEASTSARESSLVSNLQTLRSQIGLYKIQHKDLLPGGTPTTPTPSATGDVETALTTKTDILGSTWVDQATSGTPYGPYMQKVAENPFATAGDPLFAFGTGAPAGGSQWYINTDTGAIYANDGKTSSDGTLHSDL
jgi:general secretion pathway protein G